MHIRKSPFTIGASAIVLWEVLLFNFTDTKKNYILVIVFHSLLFFLRPLARTVSNTAPSIGKQEDKTMVKFLIYVRSQPVSPLLSESFQWCIRKELLKTKKNIMLEQQLYLELGRLYDGQRLRQVNKIYHVKKRTKDLLYISSLVRTVSCVGSYPTESHSNYGCLLLKQNWAKVSSFNLNHGTKWAHETVTVKQLTYS